MITIKEYGLSNDIKRKLGLFIKTERISRHKEYPGLIENNPYTKENFCKDICHFHTLTKLENEIVKDDMLYHLFLEKLGFYFQLENEDHYNNMEILSIILKQLLYANEFLDDEILNEVIEQLNKFDYKYDCIANLHLLLLKSTSNLQRFIHNEEEFKKIESFLLFFEDIYQGMAYHYIGLSYLRKRDITKSEEYLLNGFNIYNNFNYGKGIINPNIINIYEYKKEYLNAANLCFEMEKYYINTRNYKRLIHTYNFLSYFYLMINDINSGEKYFNLCMNIIDTHENLLRYKDIVKFNFGVYMLKKVGVKESEKYLIPTTKQDNIKDFKLNDTVVALYIMTYLKYDEEEIKNLLKVGLEDEKLYANSYAFKYFKYKYEKTGYHRKYALETLIPHLKEKKATDELLFIYEDLYG